MAFTIGLTGGIATGKSTVSNMLTQLDIPVIDADVIAREVVEPGREAYKKIVDVFGEQILQSDFSINRKALGEVIFADEQKRHTLNRIIHPAIRREMLDQHSRLIELGEKTIVLDIPLLFESKLTHLVDKVIVVFVSEHVQLKRLTKRDGIKEIEAQKRINSQMPIEEKIKFADEIIDNNDSIESTHTQLLSILKKWNVIEPDSSSNY